MEAERKGLLAAVLAAVFALPAAAAPVMNFDQGVDMKAVMETIHDGAAVSNPAFVIIGNDLTATRDCKLFAFRADDPLVSPPSLLQSAVYQTVCEVYEGKKHCHDELLRTEKRNVTVALQGNRTTLPWERDVFNV